MAVKFNEDVQYTPEEQAEIDRIVSIMPGAPVPRVRSIEIAPEEDEFSSEEAASDFSDFGELETEDQGGIEDITSLLTIDESAEPESEFESSVDVGNLSAGEDTDFFSSADFGAAEPEAETPVEEFPSFDTEFAEEPLDSGSSADFGSFDFGEVEPEPALGGDEFPSADLGGEDLSFDFSEAEAPEEKAPEASGAGFGAIKDKILSKFKKKKDLSTTEGQIESLLEDEPDSLDIQDISSDLLVDEEETGDEFAAEEPFGDMDFHSEPIGGFDEVSLEGGAEFGGPDLSDLSVESPASLPEADIADIPQMDLGSFHDELSASADDEFSFDAGEAEAELGTSIPSVQNIDQIESVVRSERPAMERGDYDTEEVEPLDLSVHEMRKLKKAIQLMPYGLMKAVKDTILHDKLPKEDTADLVNMILDGAAEAQVQSFLEDRLGIPINIHEEGMQRRRIYARDEYTQEGKERQKALLRRTRNISIAMVAVTVLGVLSYQYIYKPLMAKHLINKGVELIRRNADPKTDDYVKAEELFRTVDERYIHDYLYGYNQYGRAYFDKREFDRSLDKLNRGYRIAEKENFSDYEILNNLGYFYSKVPARFFNEVKPLLKRYYFETTKPIGKIDTQLDVALDFYRKANNKNPDDVTSLYGMGNAYFYQGQTAKARKFFEDIVKLDPDSPIGYAGLFNLFVETDNFPETVSLYVNIRDRNMLKDFPSPLLAKLAWYVMEKKKNPEFNIRINYGIQSPRLKDESDNPYPIVQDILKNLMKRDSKYPPLYLMYGKLSLLQKNYKLAENYLSTAVDYAKDNGQNYFGALHMLGEYYYNTKDPLRAYNYLRKAEKAYEVPADFSYEEFYRETESIGNTYALEGNIFYYFFDKIKISSDLESLEDEDVDKLEEKMENYTISQNKYEKALAAGFQSSELHYNLGRIYYMNRSYEEALGQWLNLYDDFTKSPELMYSLGNVFLKLNNLDSAKAQYTKIISLYEMEADKIHKVDSRSSAHIRIFDTLSNAYNNLGAVYQLQGNEAKSNIAYWKSIDYASKLGNESELSRVNIGRSMKGGEKITPFVNDNIPYSLSIYREDMRI